jgi:hypothetical protein
MKNTGKSFFEFLYEVKIIRKQIIFEKDELIVIGKIFGIIIINKKYIYDNIYKFIIGRCYNNFNPEGNIYTVYIDNNDQIIKIIKLKSYKECLEIINEIKKTGKKVYDDTDTYYTLEEDLFRNYYKLKKTIDEIKNE